ncbi:hypothetical protein P3T37_001759 [Kitasatospora sp. MAA4]|uniref:hypothetical protein n=1 Tax=Kitasatospora sp. MAA4 TaxID=3035093 RepID=UPI002476AD64|nr:hypothetical protein [Kitasatospora sp. MAA4]MDH6132374.1 hypothetical protein [Kitasatospora sp. MAA4]
MPIDESSDDPFENAFALALRTAADVSPARGTEALALGAARRGQRRKRRRNALAGAGALVVLVAGAGALTGWADPGGATRVTSPATTSSPPPAATTPTATLPAAPISDAQLLTLFKAQLPATWSLSEATSHGTEPDPQHTAVGTLASATVDDGHGKSYVQIDFQRLSTPVNMNADWTQCPDRTDEPFTVCSRTTRPDGSTLLVLQRYDRPDRRDGIKRWSAQLLRPDGTGLTLVESNTPTNSSYQVTRADPPLTADRLAAIATDPSWNQVMAAMPAPYVPPSGLYTGSDPMRQNFNWPPTDKILATAAPLLPAGLTEADTAGSTDTAHFTVDDGHGKSLVEVTVQDWSIFKAGVSSGADIPVNFQGATVLPDGTQVLRTSEKDYGGEPGLVRNTVDILRTDHLRILVQAFNATSQALAPTRALPTLTLDQLQALATSASWENAKS